MLNKILCLTTLFLAFGASSIAEANIHLDPYMSIAASGKYESGSTSSSLKSGSLIGARFGYSFLGFALGVDYGTGTMTPDTSPSVDAKVDALGAFASFTFPVLIRAYITYIPTTTWSYDTALGALKVIGNGTKIGVGYTGLPLVTLNLEMWTANYDKTELAGISGTTSGKSTATMLSVSLPFNF